jgi:hypothetical protein
MPECLTTGNARAAIQNVRSLLFRNSTTNGTSPTVKVDESLGATRSTLVDEAAAGSRPSS